MTILEIYKKYQIMPQLQEHQLRVAGVADVICEHITRGLDAELLQSRNNAETNPGIDRKNIIAACLLHDIGNIIKFDLSVTDKLLPGMFSKEDLIYWQKVKNGFIEKYGRNEHQASIKIVIELRAQERVVELVDCIDFQNGQKNADSEDWGKKICAYSDMRVEPVGVVSLEQRFLGLRERYDHKHKLMGGNENLRLEFEQGLREIEKQIFAKCKVQPQDITDETVGQELGSLKKFEI